MKRLVPAVLLAAACGPQASTESPEPTQLLRGVTMLESVEGEPQWRLKTPEARLLEDTQLVRSSLPQLTLLRDGAEVTRIQAGTGTYDAAAEQLLMEGRVVAHSLTDGSTLYTDLLHYSTAKRRIWTDRKVRIERPEGTVTGRGMTAAPDLSEIVLEHQETTLRPEEER